MHVALHLGRLCRVPDRGKRGKNSGLRRTPPMPQPLKILLCQRDRSPPPPPPPTRVSKYLYVLAERCVVVWYSSLDERKYFIRTWKLIYRVYETRNFVTREMYDAEIISLEKWNGTMTLVYEFYLKRVVWEIVSSGEMMNQWWWRNSFTNFVSGRIEIRNLKKRKKKGKKFGRYTDVYW